MEPREQVKPGSTSSPVRESVSLIVDPFRPGDMLARCRAADQSPKPGAGPPPSAPPRRRHPQLCQHVAGRGTLRGWRARSPVERLSLLVVAFTSVVLPRASHGTAGVSRPFRADTMTARSPSGESAPPTALKFGGTSVGDAAAFERVAAIVRASGRPRPGAAVS